VYRITFSRSLADLISKETGLNVRKVQLHLGRELSPGEESLTKLYAICKAQNLWPLRVTFFKEAAQMWANETTKILECKVSFV